MITHNNYTSSMGNDWINYTPEDRTPSKTDLLKNRLKGFIFGGYNGAIVDFVRFVIMVSILAGVFYSIMIGNFDQIVDSFFRVYVYA